MVNPDVSSSHTANFFLPLGRILRTARPDFPPVFGLLLKPQSWSVQYFGVEHQGSDSSERVSATVAEFEQQFENVWGVYHGRAEQREIDGFWEAFCEHMQSPAAQVKIRWEPETLLEAATAVLGSRPIRLGSCDDSDNVWCLNRTPEPFVFFQRAIDFAAIHSGDPAALANQLGQGERLREPYAAYPKNHPEKFVLEVSNYVQAIAPNFDQIPEATAKALVAESLYFARGRVDSGFKPSTLHHLFMPLSSLGQWRGSLCWLTQRDDYMDDITQTLQRAFEELFTQAILDSFATRLENSLLSSQRPSRDGLTAAFATLWWATEISFILDTETGATHTDVVRRDPATGMLDLRPNSSSPPPPRKGGFMHVEDHGLVRSVEIDLEHLSAQLGQGESRFSDEIRDSLNFTRIRCEFLLRDADSTPLTHSRAIAHRISVAFETQRTLRLKTEYQAHEAVGNTILDLSLTLI